MTEEANEYRDVCPCGDEDCPGCYLDDDRDIGQYPDDDIPF